MEKHRWLSSRWLHISVLFVGALFILTGAFHGNIWFDESYSVAIAEHSFADIWRIGSFDVHPVLFYWALHVIRLCGGYITAYRVFTVMGTVAFALLGYTHLRRDFGWRIGLLFSLLALFTPYVSFIAIEIRMYSWAMFAVMVTWIYGYRIMRAERIAASSLAIFFIASLASAYLHYFALLSVFIINLFLGLYFIVKRKERRRDLAVFWVQAAVQVLLYMPWIVVLLGQMGVVSTSYWVKFKFPDTFMQLLFYPLVTMQLTFALKGSYGLLAKGIAIIGCALHLLLGVAIVAKVIGFVRKRNEAPPVQKPWPLRLWLFFLKEENLPGLLSIGTYLGLILIACIGSLVLGTMMVFFRYLFCAAGPLLFFFAWLVARIDFKPITASFVALLFATAMVNQLLIIHDDYSEDNRQPLEYLAENLNEGEIVLSSDIGIEGVTAIEFPEIPQYYLNWQGASWGKGYEAYAPALHIIKSWNEILDNYTGRVWVLGTSSDGDEPVCIDDISERGDVTLLESYTFFRPYERTYYTFALIEIV